MNLYENSLLVYLSTSCWSARKLDRKASKDLTDRSGASESAARVNKHLLADSGAQLKAIVACTQEARRTVDTLSLPWDDAGNRIVSNHQSMRLVREFAHVKRKFQLLADNFVAAYPALRVVAMNSLGDLANAEDYPDAESLRSRFRLRLSLTPVAATFTGNCKDLTEEQTLLLEKHYAHRVQEQSDAAMAEAWRRLLADVSRLRGKLVEDAEGKRSVLRAAVLDGLSDRASTLRSLNVFGSHDLDMLCDEVQDKLCAHGHQELRENDALARKVRKEADVLVAKLEGFL